MGMTNEKWVRAHPKPRHDACRQCGRSLKEPLLFVGRFLPDDESGEKSAFLCRNGHITLGLGEDL